MGPGAASRVVALLLGLVGGAGGALAVRLLAPGEAGAPPAAGPGGEGRLAGIEAALRRLEERSALEARGPGLAGRPEAPATGSEAAALAGPGGEALRTALRASVREELTAVLDARAAAERGAGAAPPARPAPRKRVPLRDAARELGLTADEEAALTRIYAESTEKMIRLVAKDDAEAETIRAEVRAAAGDAPRGRALMLRYMPRALGRLGELAAIDMEEQEAVVATVGPERAQRLASEFDVVEANPLGVSGEVRIDARGGDR